MSEKVARPAIVQYVDLAQTSNVSTQDFLGKAGLSMLQTIGWVYECEVDGFECVKILSYDDMDGEANSEGIVIPKACVLKIIELSADDSHLIDKALA
jgi:hypothetical protein